MVDHDDDELPFGGEYDPDENPTCPQCGGPGVPLGTLGKLAHFRCRNCGWDFSADLEFK